MSGTIKAISLLSFLKWLMVLSEMSYFFFVLEMLTVALSDAEESGLELYRFTDKSLRKQAKSWL